MLVLQKVRGTTPRGRQWLTQISFDTSDIKPGEDVSHATFRQSEDNLKQLEYERSQLL